MAGTIPSRVNLAYHLHVLHEAGQAEAQGKEAWMRMRARTLRHSTPPFMHRTGGLFNALASGRSHHRSTSSLILST